MGELGAQGGGEEPTELGEEVEEWEHQGGVEVATLCLNKVNLKVFILIIIIIICSDSKNLQNHWIALSILSS